MFPDEEVTDAVDFDTESGIVEIVYSINNGVYQKVKNVSVNNTELWNATHWLNLSLRQLLI